MKKRVARDGAPAAKRRTQGAGVVIRKARAEDCPAIVGLWREMMAFHAERDPFFTVCKKGPDNFAKWVREAVAKDGAHVAVAELGAALAGYSLSLISRYPPVFTRDWYCDVYDLAVAAPCRRNGVGKALFEDIRQWAACEGVTRIEARIALANETSTGFWRAVGLRPYMESMYLDL